MGQERWEWLSDTCRVLVTREHGFTTDTLLLAWFSLPRPGVTTLPTVDTPIGNG